MAIEETESWYLGDLNAIQLAYPKVNIAVLKDYQQDSICGAWETFAEMIYSKNEFIKLKKEGYPKLGMKKCEWAENVGKHIEPDQNQSPSFQLFLSNIRHLLSENNKINSKKPKSI